MFKKNITNRLVIAKGVGFLLGIIIILMCNLFSEMKMGLYFYLGIILWMTIIGTMTGLMGVITKYSYLKIKINAAFRGTISGLTISLLVILMAYPTLEIMMEQMTVLTWFDSPFWILIDGIILGIIIDLITTKFTGEGEKLLEY